MLIFKIFYQVWEELSIYEGGLWERLPALFAELACRGGAQDPERPCSFGSLTEPTVFWGESAGVIEAAFPVDRRFRVLSIQMKLTIIQKIPDELRFFAC